MVVSFGSASYVFQESVMIGTICVASSGESDVPFNVTVTTSDGSAQGTETCTSYLPTYYHSYLFPLELLDYRLIGSADLVFSATSNHECIEIVIIDDFALESDELFRVFLTATSERVSIATETAMVTITDNNS